MGAYSFFFCCWTPEVCCANSGVTEELCSGVTEELCSGVTEELCSGVTEGVIAYIDHRRILTSLVLFFGYKGWVIHHSAFN